MAVLTKPGAARVIPCSQTVFSMCTSALVSPGWAHAPQILFQTTACTVMCTEHVAHAKPGGGGENPSPMKSKEVQESRKQNEYKTVCAGGWRGRKTCLQNLKAEHHFAA